MKQIIVVVILLAMIPLIASIGIISTVPISQAEPSALCKAGAVTLQHPSTENIICVKQSEAPKYIANGYIDILNVMPAMEKTSSPCKTGYVIVQNPNTGTITCELKNTASKYVARGAVVLTPINIEEDTPIGSITVDDANAPTAKLISIEKYDMRVYKNASISYKITFELSAGDTNLKDIKIQVKSDVDAFGFSVSSLNAHSSSVNVIKVNALDVDSITGKIVGYSLN